MGFTQLSPFAPNGGGRQVRKGGGRSRVFKLHQSTQRLANTFGYDVPRDFFPFKLLRIKILTIKRSNKSKENLLFRAFIGVGPEFRFNRAVFVCIGNLSALPVAPMALLIFKEVVPARRMF